MQFSSETDAAAGGRERENEADSVSVSVSSVCGRDKLNSAICGIGHFDDECMTIIKTSSHLF